MPQQTIPFIEGKYGWTFGESGWNSGMDENLVKFSFLFDRNVEGIVSTLPSPVSGTAYFLTTDNRLYFCVGGVFYSSPTPLWFVFQIRSTGQNYQYNGTTAVPLSSNSSLDSRLNSVELTLSSLGSAAYEDSTDFASSVEFTRLGLHSVKNYGVVGDGITDDTAAIQAMINSDIPMWFPEGIYLLTLSQTMVLEGGSSVCALKARSGMIMHGVSRNRVVFKLKDNESTDASPKYFNIISGNTAIDNLHIKGITFDINGQNNKISPNRGSGIYNFFNCAALMISGSVATVGTDARLTNSSFKDCAILNSPGVTCIGLGQSNSVGTALGDNIEISGNLFNNNGIDANDHSSIYMWANNVRVYNNVFSHPNMSSGIQGPIAAAELHGSQNYFTNNVVRNYLWGCYVAGNFTSVSRSQHVKNNDFFCS